MATTKTCDKCGGEAVCSIEIQGSTLTTVKKDLCQDCFIEFKRLVRWATGQELEVIE